MKQTNKQYNEGLYGLDTLRSEENTKACLQISEKLSMHSCSSFALSGFLP